MDEGASSDVCVEEGMEKYYVNSAGQLNTRSGHSPDMNVLKDETQGHMDLVLLKRTDGKGGENPVMVVGGAAPHPQTKGTPINVVDGQSPKSRGTDWEIVGIFSNTPESLKELEAAAGKNVIRFSVFD